jgi:phosphoenolpyruvate-protein phosphotransferase (PTS system enzyme I)
MTDTDTLNSENTVIGIGASPGICIGKAYLVDTEGVDLVRRYGISADGLRDELNRFKSAVSAAEDELTRIIEESGDDFSGKISILKTHKLLLKDKQLYGRTLETIENEMVNAEWALKKVGSAVKAMFKEMADAYLRERVADIGQVTDRIMRNLVGVNGVDIAAIDKRVILVAPELSPADASQINLERIKGFITDHGGKTSHTGIIARSLGIPAVMGLGNISSRIRNDDVIIVDGTTGSVLLDPSDDSLMKYEERHAEYEQRKAEILRRCHFVAKTLNGQTVKTMGNIELPEEVVSVLDHGADGIGLYRTEFHYMNRPGFPEEEELFEKYKDVVEVMAPKPVIIRTLDVNGDKAINNGSRHPEPNPALGLRAIRYCLVRQDVFKTQLRAILRAAAYGNVRIIFPMIARYEEITQAKALLYEAADELKSEGLPHQRDIEVGIMIEVPSAVVMADILAQAVDFFSIGTNDLIQYSLAIDRGNRKVAHMFHALNPAIIRLLKQTTDAARKYGTRVFMCGEMAADPLNLPILLGMGIDELSMSPQSIPAIKTMIRLLNSDQTRAFIPKILNLKTTADVIEAVEQAYGDLITDQIYC